MVMEQETPRNRGGRPKADSPKIGKKVYLTAEEWEYVGTWKPHGADVNESIQVLNMIDRLQRTAPDGISSQPPKSKKPPQPRIPNAVSQWGKRHGLSPKSALVELVKRGLASETD